MPRYGIRKYPARDLFDDVVKGEETTVVTAMLRGEEACEKGAEVIHEMYRESIRLLRLNNALPFGEEWDEKLADLHYRTMLPILVDYMESFLNDGRMMDWFFCLHNSFRLSTDDRFQFRPRHSRAQTRSNPYSPDHPCSGISAGRHNACIALGSCLATASLLWADGGV